MSAIRFGPTRSLLGFDHRFGESAVRSIADVLGLQEIPKPKTFDFVALWFDLGDGQTLHLLQKPQPDTRSPRHFALAVRDAKAAREHFRARNRDARDGADPALRPLLRPRPGRQSDRADSMDRAVRPRTEWNLKAGLIKFSRDP